MVIYIPVILMMVKWFYFGFELTELCRVLLYPFFLGSEISCFTPLHLIRGRVLWFSLEAAINLLAAYCD